MKQTTKILSIICLLISYQAFGMDDEIEKAEQEIFDEEMLDNAISDPLIDAFRELILRHNIPALEQLIASNNVNINTEDSFGFTPLGTATFYGDTEIMAILLKAHADVNALQLAGETPLHYATRLNNVLAIQMLVDAHADTHIRTRVLNENWTALETAAAYGLSKALEILLKVPGTNVNDTNPYGRTSLHLAAGGGSPDTVEMLLKAGADISAKDYKGKTPLHSAVTYNRPLHPDQTKVVNLLLQAGADFDAKDVYGNTPLYMAVVSSQSLVVHDYAVVQTLIAAGADPNTCNNIGCTPLQYAIYSIILDAEEFGQNITPSQIAERLLAMTLITHEQFDQIVNNKDAQIADLQKIAATLKKCGRSSTLETYAASINIWDKNNGIPSHGFFCTDCCD